MKLITRSFNHIKLYGFKSFNDYTLYYLKKIFENKISTYKTYIRIQKISKPDKVLGVFRKTLDNADIKTLNQIFGVKKLLSNNNEYSLKDYAGTNLAPKLKVLVFSPLNINNSKKYVENDLTINVINSALESGCDVKHYYGVPLKNSRYVLEQDRLTEFENMIDFFEPNLLCIDSNSPIKHATFSSELILKLKKKYGFKVLMFQTFILKN